MQELVVFRHPMRKMRQHSGSALGEMLLAQTKHRVFALQSQLSQSVYMILDELQEVTRSTRACP